AAVAERAAAGRDPVPGRHDRLDDRGGGQGRAGPAADRRGDLQPAEARDAARHRRDRRLHRSQPVERADGLGLSHPEPVQHTPAPRPAADPDLEPRAALAPCRAQPGPRPVPLLRALRGGRAPRVQRELRPVPAGRRPVPGVRRVGGSTRKVGVIGWPVSESLSPVIHNAAFEALGLDWIYLPLPVPPGELPRAIAGLPALGFAGANVTMPHKTEAAALVDALSEDA